MDQEDMKIPDFGKSMGECFKIQSIDLTGSRAIGDDFFNNLMNGEQVLDGIKTKPGLPELHTLKVNFLIRIMDGSVQKVLQGAPKIENLEMPGCENMTEYGIDSIFKNFRTLTFIDINHIPVVTPAFWE